MKLRLLLLAALLGFGTPLLEPAPAAAQQGIAVDTAAVLSAVARDLQAQGRAEVAEALLRHILERYPASAEAEAARLQLAGRVEPTERSGATELYVWGTGYGLWLGIAVPGALGANDPEPFGFGLILGGPGGFLASRALLSDWPITIGQARAITWGGTWGTWQGYGWGEVLDLTSTKTRFSYETCVEFNAQTGECLRFDTITGEYEEHDTQKVFTSLLAGGLLGVAAGSVVASRTSISPGTATLLSFGSLWGSWAGFALSTIANQDEKEDGTLLWSLVGGNVGLLSTALVAPSYDISQARARLINIAGVVGLLGGFGVDLIVQPDDAAVVFGIPLATSAAGLLLGASLTRDYDREGRRAGREEPAAHALVVFVDGRFGLGTPAPTPTFLRAGPSAERVPGVRFDLLHARF
ncbi:MAG: tetratricopeptide repeat protein [Gemmatimonadota bacterium]